MLDNNKVKILIVDDVEMNLIILSEIIKTMGYESITKDSAKGAIEVLGKETPSVILTDISMPDMDGLEFCKMLKQDVYTRDIPIICISALNSTEDLSAAFEAGAVDYISKPFDPANVKMRVQTHLKLANMQRELEDANRRLNMMLKKQMMAGRGRQKELFNVVGELAAERDPMRTYSKISESRMVRILAQAMQFSEEFEDKISDSFLDDVEIAASLHDVGTIVLPDSVVLKETALTPEEFEVLKSHTEYGYKKVSTLMSDNGEDDVISITQNLILYHHENYDGTGFPKGLKGEEIPLCARIMRIIDSYESLVNDRIYHKAISHEEAVKMIEENAGTLFDPNIVKIFVKIQKKFNV